MSLDKNQPSPPKVYPRLMGRLRMLMWLCLIGAGVMVAEGGSKFYSAWRLRSQGVRSDGSLVQSDTASTGQGRIVYRLRIEYRPEGHPRHIKDFVVNEATYRQVVEDGVVPVTYLPSDPTKSAIGEEVPLPTESLAIGGGLALVAAGMWWFRRRKMAQVEAYVRAAAPEPTE